MESIIKAWNNTVGPRDTVFVCGDFHFGDPGEVLNQLNGNLHLIQGNHDSKKTLRHPRWESVSHKKYQRHEGVLFVMDHYPMETWKQSRYGSIHLHGHCHGNGRKITNRFDVGWDVYGALRSFDYFLTQRQERGPYQHD